MRAAFSYMPTSILPGFSIDKNFKIYFNLNLRVQDCVSQSIWNGGPLKNFNEPNKEFWKIVRSSFCDTMFHSLEKNILDRFLHYNRVLLMHCLNFNLKPGVFKIIGTKRREQMSKECLSNEFTSLNLVSVAFDLKITFPSGESDAKRGEVKLLLCLHFL